MSRRRGQETAEWQAFKGTSSVFLELLSQSGLIESFAWKLFEKDVISQLVRDDVNNIMLSDSQRASKLLSAIEKAIAADCRRYRTVYKTFLELEDVALKDTAKEMDGIYWNKSLSKEFNVGQDYPWTVDGGSQSVWRRYCCCVVSVVLLALFMFAAGVGLAYLLLQPSSEIPVREPAPGEHSQPSNGSTAAGLLDTSKPYSRTFASADYDLPTAPEPFVGRERILKHIVSDLLNKLISIVGIHGPPAFGKSALAKHVGHRLASAKIPVRHINMQEYSLLKTQLSANIDVTSNSSDIQNYESGELAFLKLNEATRVEIQLTKLRNIKYLLKWAQEVRATTVLILDNCDDVLVKAQDEFQTLVKELVELSFHNLKIMVTSQQRIMFSDNFVAHTATELSPRAAETLLRKLSNLTSDEAKTLSKLVGYCPLTLKVTAQLLNQKTPTILMEMLGKDLTPVVSNEESLPNDRFMVVMDFAFKRLPYDLQKLLYFVSFYPGSFTSEAVQNMSFHGDLLYKLVNRFLVEEDTYKDTLRYSMHKLIRDYFKNTEQSYLKYFSTQYSFRDFSEEFRRYYSLLTVQYARLLTRGNRSAAKRLMEHERHNFDYLLNMLLTTHVRTYSERVAVVVAYREKMLPSYEYLSKHLNLGGNEEVFIPICNIVGNITCLSVFAKLTEEHEPSSIMFVCSFTSILKAKGLKVFGTKEGKYNDTLPEDYQKFFDTLQHDDCICTSGFFLTRVTWLATLLLSFFVSLPYLFSEIRGRLSLLQLLVFLRVSFWTGTFLLLENQEFWNLWTLAVVLFQLFDLIVAYALTRVIHKSPSYDMNVYLSYCSSCCTTTLCFVSQLKHIMHPMCYVFTDHQVLLLVLLTLVTVLFILVVNLCLFFLVTVLINYNLNLPSLFVMLTSLCYYFFNTDPTRQQLMF